MTHKPDKTSTPAAIRDLSAYESSLYADLDLTGLVAYVLSWLQEQRLPTTFENVVIASFLMFPVRFSLQGYVEYPDAARVNRTLLQLGPKYRNWARGSVQKGFILTDSGARKVKEVEDTLKGVRHAPRHPAMKKQLPRTMDLTKDINDLTTSALFSKWATKRLSDGTELELLDLLGAYAYTPARAMRDRISQLENAASQLGNDEVVQFLRAVRKTFPQSLRDR